MKHVDHAPTFEDCFNMLCGDLIGDGIHRKVFACKLRPELVVKVEDQPGLYRWFANVHEMRFWNDHDQYEPVRKWLAPCEFLSPDGRILLQQRVDPLPREYEMPAALPGFLTDFKRENYGLFEGRFVCVDYSTTIPNPSTKLRKVSW
jgi:hypothetical protein